MIITIIILLLVIMAAIFTWVVARRQSPPIRSTRELLARAKPVDLESFRNLVDIEEEEYLRSSVGSREFRRLQRMRMLAAAGYVRDTAHNARLMLQFADLARRSRDTAISRVGAELAESALELRLYSVLAICFFYVRFVFPSLPPRISNFASRYERLRENAARLTRIQQPAEVAGVVAAL